MSRGARRQWSWAVALAVGCLVVAGGCSGSGSSSTTTTAAAAAPTTTATPATTSAATTAPAAAALPNSCSAIASVVGPYVGGITYTHQFGTHPNGVSCEFANFAAAKIVIVDIGRASAAEWALLRSRSGGGGRTITPVPGMGSSAFTVSKNGITAGMSVLTSQGAFYVVESRLSVAQFEALIHQLMHVG